MSPNEPLTLALARQVLFLSFRFSQGSPEAQEVLLMAVSLWRPQWSLDEEMVQALEQLSPSIGHLAEAGVHASFPSTTPVHDELRQFIGSMQAACAFPTPVRRRIAEEARDATLVRVAQVMIIRDGRYLEREAGRPRSSRAPHPCSHPSTDPFLSHFCHFVLLGQTSGAAVFDELFTEIRSICNEPGERLQRILADPLTAMQLPRVIQVYNRHHPTSLVAWLPPTPATEQP